MLQPQQMPLMNDQPSKLYDICIKYICNNISDILIKNLHKDTIRLNSTICESLLSEYSQIYDLKLRKQERQQYYECNKVARRKRIAKTQSESTTKMTPIVDIDRPIENQYDENLIPTHVLLLELAKYPSRFQLNKLVYKQCVIKQTPLYVHLKEFLNLGLVLERTRIQEHLSDNDFAILKLNANNMYYLDICPCALTGKFIKMINQNFSEKIKYFKLNNYCNWKSCRLFDDYDYKPYCDDEDDDYNGDDGDGVDVDLLIDSADADLYDDDDYDEDEDEEEDIEDFNMNLDIQSTTTATTTSGDDDDDDDDDIEDKKVQEKDLYESDEFFNEETFQDNESNEMQVDDSETTTSTSDLDNDQHKQQQDGNDDDYDDDEEEEDDDQGYQKRLPNRNILNKHSYKRLMRQYRFLNNSKLKKKENLQAAEEEEEEEIGTSANSNTPASNLFSSSISTRSLSANINLIKNLLNRKILSHSPFNSFIQSATPPPPAAISSTTTPTDKKLKKTLKTTKKPHHISTTQNKKTLKSNLTSFLQSILNNKRNYTKTFASKNTGIATATGTTADNQNDEDNNKTFMNEEEAAEYLIKNLKLLKTMHTRQRHHKHDKQSDECNMLVKDYELSKTFKFKNLQYLTLENLKSTLTNTQLNDILLNLNSTLKYLNLSNTCHEPNLSGIIGKIQFKHSLRYLYFCNYTQNLNDFYVNLNFICLFKNLILLDVSNYVDIQKISCYKNASFILAKLCFLLKNLTHLDISGTNLGGPTLFKIEDEIVYLKKKLKKDLLQNPRIYSPYTQNDIENFQYNLTTSIIGLACLNKQLELFGCLNCENSVSIRTNIPAKKIAGDHNEADLFTSLEVYLDRPLFIVDILNHLYELYRDNQIENKFYGGQLIMKCMCKYIDNSRIQISGSASLFYVLKYSKDENKPLTYFYSKSLIEIIINAMEEHIDESAMRRNCVLIMCRLNLPDDVLFVSDRLINILLKIFDDYIEEKLKQQQPHYQQQQLVTDRPEPFVLRTAMHLFNILACSVHGSDKSAVGALAIPVAMDLIRTKVQFKEPDEILEVTWSFLWNITDETPENCRLFLDECEGMSVFMDCIQLKRPEIVRNMMGLLGNVAEVKELRNRLLKEDYIKTFRQLIFNINDGIEIPYNSAGVLTHIMSDGEEVWNAHLDMDRNLIINDLKVTIDNWNIKSERNINYRSFEPIFRLVQNFSNPICQHWSCWALANLTTVYPDTYCTLLVKENGHTLLKTCSKKTILKIQLENMPIL